MEGPSWGRERRTCCCRTSRRRAREWRTSCRRRRRRGRLGSSSTEPASIDANKLRTLRLPSQTDGQTEEIGIRSWEQEGLLRLPGFLIWSQQNRNAQHIFRYLSSSCTVLGLLFSRPPPLATPYLLTLSLSLSPAPPNNPTHRREKHQSSHSVYRLRTWSRFGWFEFCHIVCSSLDPSPPSSPTVSKSFICTSFFILGFCCYCCCWGLFCVTESASYWGEQEGNRWRRKKERLQQGVCFSCALESWVRGG